MVFHYSVSFSFYSVTNYFVVNLSVADLLVTTICMPMAVSQEVSSIWVHSEFMCKFSFYLQGKYVQLIVLSSRNTYGYHYRSLFTKFLLSLSFHSSIFLSLFLIHIIATGYFILVRMILVWFKSNNVAFDFHLLRFLI